MGKLLGRIIIAQFEIIRPIETSIQVLGFKKVRGEIVLGKIPKKKFVQKLQGA